MGSIMVGWNLRVEKRRATSEFSWASLDTWTAYHRGRIYQFAEPRESPIWQTNVVNIHCALKGQNPFSEVKEGYIILKVPVAQDI